MTRTLLRHGKMLRQRYALQQPCLFLPFDLLPASVSFSFCVWQDAEEDEDEEKEKEEDTSGPDYNYLLSMPMWYLTKEKKDELCRQRDAKVTISLCWMEAQLVI